MVRASCILQLALGNIGVSGGGANIFRGHDNVQGATDVGPNPDSLPGYYGLAEGAWKHWAAVWGVDYEWLKAQFAAKAMMEKPGITGVALDRRRAGKNDKIDQDPTCKAIFYWGHAPNSQTRGLENEEGDGKLDLLVVVIDPYPVATAAWRDAGPGRTASTCCRPATQFETSVRRRRRTARSSGARGHRAAVRVQARPHPSCTRSPKFGFGDQFVQELRDGEKWRRGMGRAHARVHPARDQQGRLDHRLHRPVAGAPEAAHEEHVDVRREALARPTAGDRPVRRRLFRPAVAVLRHAGAESILGRPTCTTPRSTSWMAAAAASAPTSASSATACRCWPKTARIRRRRSDDRLSRSSTTCC